MLPQPVIPKSIRKEYAWKFGKFDLYSFYGQGIEKRGSPMK